MNLPNKLTVLRIIMIPVFMIFAFPYPDWFPFVSEMAWFIKCKDIVAFTVFVVASITDFLDGYIARKNNLVTDFGKFLDPIADKLLVTASLLSLAKVSDAYVWATMIILIREFVVTGIRLVAAGKGVVIAAGKMGKLKTATQMIAISVLLFAPVLPVGIIRTTIFLVGNIVMAVSVLLTIISGVEYIYQNRSLLESK
ncbi:MAG: CDP-diacylglycerol--glycerol-3-phosphate 3-phosphatidyltransferase [Clostridia bacterium]|nr:CDP-diacylglycerol--glycerol-3-phosphate 3-phosphatidyltransferase [Clostridia bacterium]